MWFHILLRNHYSYHVYRIFKTLLIGTKISFPFHPVSIVSDNFALSDLFYERQ